MRCEMHGSVMDKNCSQTHRFAAFFVRATQNGASGAQA
jgi:hypothetical protein